MVDLEEEPTIDPTFIDSDRNVIDLWITSTPKEKTNPEEVIYGQPGFEFMEYYKNRKVPAGNPPNPEEQAFVRHHYLGDVADDHLVALIRQGAEKTREAHLDPVPEFEHGDKSKLRSLISESRDSRDVPYEHLAMIARTPDETDKETVDVSE
jgi:hypothetical protein